MKMTASHALASLLTALTAGCSLTSPPRPVTVDGSVMSELERAADRPRSAPTDNQINAALMPPLRLELPSTAKPIEPRFDLSVNNAPAAQVLTSIVSGTRYSMLVHQDLTGTITVNLKDVTVREALDALRDLYGYDYRVDGTRIFVQPPTLQTRVFQVNYLIGQRLGRSDVRVTSGSVGDAPPSAGGGVPGVPGTTGLPTTPGTGGSGSSLGAPLTDSSRIQTTVRNDFWEELGKTLTEIVGREGGRSIVVNSQAGLIVARAMPNELRQLEAYLRAIRLSVERQVMLEAKIVEVTLSQQYQAGINWALFSRSGRSSAGQIGPNTLLQTSGVLGSGGLTASPRTDPAAFATGNLAPALIAGLPGGSLFGLAFQTPNFAALLTFLESQGSVQVISSPRIATMNNQKAVLKVGTDQFFITSIAGGSTTTGIATGGTTSFPTLTLRPFFSGVALDVTPQIDESSNIVLHVHPSVSNVQQDDKIVNLGAVFGGAVTLPVARSTVSETDSVVRVQDGNIVAIGGLMKLDLADQNAGVPGLQDSPSVGGLFRSESRAAVKKELIILIKPTVIHSDADWAADLQETRDRVLNMNEQGNLLPRR
jgi:MSHA biogenesis protein MshL